jgi:hypothetical protein
VTFYLRIGRDLRSLRGRRRNAIIPPSPPPVPDVFWFDSATNQYFIPPNRQSGDTVTQWQDTLNGANSLSDAGGVTFRPTYLANQQNGLSALSFNADRLRGRPYPIPLTQNFTLFVVARFNNINTQQLCETQTGAVTQLAFGISGNRYTYTAAGGISIAPMVADTQWHVHAMTFNSTLAPSLKIQARVDGVYQILAPSIAPGTLNISTTDFFAVGSRVNGTLFFSGQIGEIMLYHQALTNSQVTAVENSLLTKWGI